MNVDELLAYKPTRGTKRARDQSSAESLPSKKSSTVGDARKSLEQPSELTDAQ